MPRLSVLLPVRNAEAFLAEAVDSILRQSYRDFELLLLYSPSSDASRAVLESRARRDPRAVVLDVAGSNLAACLNEGLRAANGELIARMDADDIALPERFARQVAAFDARPALGVLGSAVRYINAAGRPGRILVHPRGADIERAFAWGCPFTHSAVMMRRAPLERCGGYRELFSHAEDYDLWLRIGEVTELDNLPEILLYYRLHGRNSVILKALETRRHAFFAQAAQLVRHKSGIDPLDGPAALPSPESLPLSEDEFAGLRGRILAGAAHLIGDARDDPESAEWWPWPAKIADAGLRRETEFLCAVRAARFYGRDRPLRCLAHCLRAVVRNPARAARYGAAIVRSSTVHASCGNRS
ncbi:MAG: glycosyltransferase [Desulfovibrio sp.]|nr:glycosyltransferase [Desulfovibrio sp.]